MRYKIKQALYKLLDKAIDIKKSFATPLPSFPRGRESKLTVNLKWIAAYAGITNKKGVAIYA